MRAAAFAALSAVAWHFRDANAWLGLWQIEWALRSMAWALAVMGASVVVGEHSARLPALNAGLRPVSSAIGISFAVLAHVFGLVGVIVAGPAQLGLCVFSLFTVKNLWLGFKLGGVFLGIAALLAILACLGPGRMEEEDESPSATIALGLTLLLVPAWFIGFGLFAVSLVPGV